MAISTTRLSPLDQGRLMTLAEFAEAEEEEGHRYELARGVVEVTKVPGTRYRQVVTNLYDCVSNWRRDHPGVILGYGGGEDFRIWVPAMDSGRNPDLAVVLRDGPGSVEKNPVPSLVAEVVSAQSGHRDYVIKRAEYLVFGLAEYWIVDFQLRRLTLLIRDGAAWAEQTLSDDQVIPSAILPGLTTTVNNLWLDLDYYDQEVEDDNEEVDPVA